MTQRALLAFLLLNPNRAVSIPQAIDALWGETPPASAKNMLHNAVWGLRKTLKDLDPSGDTVALLSQKPGYLLRIPAEQVDLHRFRELVTQARAAGADGDPAAAAAAFRRALALWRGPALADLVSAGITWPVLGALDESRLTAWEDCLDAELACGRHGEVIGELTVLTDTDPLRERLHGQLMLALYRSGRQADALAAYRRARMVFIAELGIEPSPGLRQLERAVLSQDPALSLAREPAAGTALAPGNGAAGPPAPGEGWEHRRVSTVLLECRPAWQAGTDPQTRDQQLSAVLEVVRATASRFEGIVAGTIGPVVQLIFGSDRTREDDPARAVAASLALRDRLRSADGLPEDTAEIRIAVTTSDTLVSRNGQHGAPMMAGEAREGLTLLSLTPAHEVMVCPATYRAGREGTAFAPGPAGNWRPLSATAASRPGEPVALVERRRETELLDRLLEDTVQGRRPQLLTVLGEAGLGKTRLVGELLRSAERHPAQIRSLVARLPDIAGGVQRAGEAAGEGSAYFLLHDLVKSCTGIKDTDPLGTAAGKLARTIRQVVCDPQQADWVEANLRLLTGIDGAHPAGRPAEDVWRATRVLLEETAAASPLLLVLEDLHRADDVLLDFVDEFTEELGPVPLLVVVTARPELLWRRSAWSGGKRDATTVSLTALSDAGTAQLLQALATRHGLSGTGADSPTAPATWDPVSRPGLITRIGGNPFFAEEYIRMLAESAAPGAAEADALPESVRTVIAARLDTVPPEERAVLLDSSVLGPAVWPAAVAALCGREPAEVRRCLDALTRRGLLTRCRWSSVAGEPEYAFGHALTREIAYARLPVDARAVRHGLAASWIEKLPFEHSARLAYHYCAAVTLTALAGRPTTELSDRARAVLAGAGRRAWAMGAHRAAVHCLRAAVELCPAQDPARPELLLRYGKAQAECDGTGEATLLEARDMLLMSGDLTGAASAEFHLAALADRRVGHLASRVRRDRALELVRHDDGPEATELRCGLALALAIDGRCEEAEKLARRALADAERLDRPDLTADSLKALGAARVDLGDLDGVADFEHAVRILAGHGMSTTRALGNLSCALAKAGRLDSLPAVRDDALRAAAVYGDAMATRMLLGSAVVEHYWAGEWADAATQATGLLRSSGPDWLPLRGSWHTVIGRISLARGDLDHAGEHATLGLSAARRLADPQDLCPALAFSARVAEAAGRPAEARGFVERLLTLLEGRTLLPDIGVDLPLVLTRLGYAASALDQVRPSPWSAAARAYLTGDLAKAADCYRRIGSLPDELQASLGAAERAEADGDLTGAEQQLAPTAAFARENGVLEWTSVADRIRARTR
ncbi:BTAD domain-containing putative transcriptional regulator [Kitasatospora sp. NPDC057015]|uniref:BTAD domain-containing putative transcriptional regulator n=1 Tax=Kitasatospora sp. NPDC057015 TaxID=3346001 RepID=UPI003638F351